MASLNYKSGNEWKKVSGGKTGVLTFKGRAGVVTPKEGDYTAEMVGARPNTWMPNIAEVGGVNPNLLDNWYFANPVNQRGQTEYTGAGYTIDRWTVIGSATVAIGLDGITFHTTTNANVTQRLENALTEDTVFTFSVLNKTGNITIRIRDTNWGDYGNATITGEGIVAVTATVPKGVTPMMQFYCDPGESITVVAVKLELGSTQTLAHQDADGNWVLNEIPDYGEELRKCQRYQLFMSHYEQFRATDIQQNYIDFTIPVPVTMRAVPQVVGEETISVLSDRIAQSGFSFQVVANGAASLRLRATKENHGLPDAYMEFTQNGAGFDANL